jgi:hypothetical protein
MIKALAMTEPGIEKGSATVSCGGYCNDGITLFIHAGGSKMASNLPSGIFNSNASRLESFDFAFDKFKINNGILLYKVLSSTATTDNEFDITVLSYFGQLNNAICTCEYL